MIMFEFLLIATCEFIKFCFLTEEAMFSWEKKLEILVSEYSEWSKTSRNVIFNWREDVCGCVRFSTFQTLITHKWLEISI